MNWQMLDIENIIIKLIILIQCFWEKWVESDVIELVKKFKNKNPKIVMILMWPLSKR